MIVAAIVIVTKNIFDSGRDAMPLAENAARYSSLSYPFNQISADPPAYVKHTLHEV
jgi:hypothetical protein